MNGDGPLSFEAIINDQNWQARLNAMERRMLGFTNTTAQQGSKIDSVFQNIGKLAAGAFAINGLSQLPQELFRVRSEFEALEISFTTMLRSKSKADAFLKEGAAFAATSPFSLRDVGTAQKQLLAYGVSVNEIIPSLKRLGDISAGLGLPLERLTYLYGTTKTQGRLFAQDLNQFVGSGIPLIAELAKQFGVAEDKVRGLVEDGKVGFKEVKKAIEGMTSGSGIFAGTLDAQSKSLFGLKERLGDAYDAMLNDIGKKNQDIATELFTTATTGIQHYQDVINIVEVAAATYGTYRAAVLLVSVAQRAQLILLQSVALEQGLAAAAGEVLTAQQARQIVVSKLLQQAQASLNATMLANPYVLVGTALAALVTTYLVYREEVQHVKTAQELLAESAKDTSGSLKQQGAEAKRLIGVIQNQNVAESERIKAYDQLKSIAPEIIGQLDFQRTKTADLTKELNLYLVSLEKKIRLESAQSAFKAAVDQDIEAAERLKKAQDGLTKQNGLPSAVVIGTGPNAKGGGSISGLAQAKDELNKAVAAKAKAAQAIKDVETSINTIYTGGSKDFINAEITRIELLRSKITDKLSPAYKNAEDSLNALTKQRDALTAAESAGTKAENLTLKVIQDKIRDKRAELNLTNNTDAQNAKIRAEIAMLEAQERKLTGKKNKAEKDAEKVGPLGSLSYYDNVIKKTDEALSKIPKDDTTSISRLLAVKAGAEQKAAEIRALLETPAGSVKYFEAIASAAQAALEKTPVTNTAAIERQKQVIINAQAQAEEARKLIVIRSFDEELAYKKSQFELYQKWVESYGKQSADVQFSNLKKSGEDYLDFLNKQIASLENDKENVGLTDTQAGNLSSLRDQRQELTGQKTAIDQFRDSLQQARNSSASLADYLDILKQKQAELNTKPNTQEYLALRQQVATDLVDTQQQLSRELNGYLQNVTGAEEQRLAVTKRFADLRLALENNYASKIKDAAYATTKAKIDKGEKDELKEINERATQASDAYKKLDEVILSSGRKAQRERLALLNEYLKKEKAAADTQTYKGKLKDRNDTVATIKNEDLDRLSQYGQLVGQFGSALTSLGGDSAKAGEALISLSSTIGLVADSFKKNIDKSQLYATAISGLVSLFSAITDAAAKRTKAENEYYASVIAQQQQYNLLLNEQLAIRSKNSNPFIEDYTAELQDNFEARKKAQAKLDESLKKLNEGRAKEGLKNQLDNGGALKLIGSGAATGAAIGSIVPGIGTAIGAVVGGAVGVLTALFGGATKKADEFGALLERYPGLIQQSADGTKRVNMQLAQSLIDTGQLDDKTKALVQTTIEWQKQVDATGEAIQSIVKTLVGELGDKLRDSLVNAFKEGTDAALAFKGTLEDVIEGFVTKLLYTQIFAPYFKKLGEEITKSLDTDNGGDGNIIDDLERFYKETGPATEKLFKGLQQYKDFADSKGFKILQPTSTSGTKNPNSTGQAIQGVTESTANVLEGQLNAMRITQATIESHMRQSLMHLSGIEQNTARIQRTNEVLDEMNRSLKTLASNPTRGLGQPG